ncbi:unnamed protein product (macronuclear) [Paramecium tetraurelia]|uniref:Casein kinase I n=1 Tax=Paramecium tetraurelia TaxID=5888 RepID=A0CES1_PARTE|nr:uncharacterized protein GSPATT00037727001 [Paramecium tetraurelia]CAK69288.1 unnamed protein product [Paramecium tetraurelia]|eukprot:XP_001436685.1 hypothetical protein (macronuclear) [Paramecium tetraurelia strain d4-2]
MGENLEQYRQKKGNLNQILPIGLEIVKILKELYSLGVMHRDIKPENFVMQEGMINLIDYGLLKISDYGHHIYYKQNKGMIGTARFESTNSLKNIEQSRRDDLESLGYMLIYLHQAICLCILSVIRIKISDIKKSINFWSAYSTV